MADRGGAPVVGKALELGIVVLLVGMLSAALFAGAVPHYQSMTAERLADRSVAGGAHTLERAVDGLTTMRDRRVKVTLRIPAMIAGEAYQLRLDGATLSLWHPDPGLRRRIRVTHPANLRSASGTIASDATGMVVTIRHTDDGRVIRIEGWSR